MAKKTARQRKAAELKKGYERAMKKKEGPKPSLLGVIWHGRKVWGLYTKAVKTYRSKGGRKMIDYILASLAQPSAWRGIIALATSLGLFISPELSTAIVATGLALIGLIGAFIKDKK